MKRISVNLPPKYLFLESQWLIPSKLWSQNQNEEDLEYTRNRKSNTEEK